MSIQILVRMFSAVKSSFRTRDKFEGHHVTQLIRGVAETYFLLNIFIFTVFPQLCESSLFYVENQIF